MFLRKCPSIDFVKLSNKIQAPVPMINVNEEKLANILSFLQQVNALIGMEKIINSREIKENGYSSILLLFNLNKHCL